jgi:hypothetical protein
MTIMLRCGWGTLQFALVIGGAENPTIDVLPRLRQLESLWGVGLVSWQGRWQRNRHAHSKSTLLPVQCLTSVCRPEGEGTATFADGGVYHGKCMNKWRERRTHGRDPHEELVTFVGLLKRRTPVDGCPLSDWSM